MNKKIIIILIVMFVAYYISKANAGTQLTYRIANVKQVRFEAATLKFLIEIVAINPTSVSVNLQNADVGVYLSGSYLGRGVLVDNQNIQSLDYQGLLESETYFSGRLQNDLTRIQPNAETSFYVSCSVQLTDLIGSIGGVISDLSNKQLTAQIKGTVKAELLTIPIDAPIVLQLPKFL
jgi:hypothetical protein